MRVLLVEDEPRAAQLLSKGLREQAYAVDVARDGRHALYQTSITEYDAIVLDVMLPGLDGFEVCRELRRGGSHVPVLMLTARDANRGTNLRSRARCAAAEGRPGRQGHERRAGRGRREGSGADPGAASRGRVRSRPGAADRGDAQQEQVPFGRELVIRGAEERLSPILMTALVTSLALVPIVLGGDRSGHEIEHPMAVVIIGGLVTSTALNLFLLPSIYLRYGRTHVHE